MERRRIKLLFFAVGITSVLLVFQNCGKVKFANKTGEAESNQMTSGDPVGVTQGASTAPNPPLVNPPMVTPSNLICDPFESKNRVDPRSGVEGTLHYTQARLPEAECAGTPCTSRDYIAKGKKVDATLFMSQIFVPTRNFSDGFSVEGQGKLKDENGQDLVEWFATDLKSNFVLRPEDADGDYQFAIISDDGITLTSTMDGQDLLVDEGEHSPRLRCSPGVVHMNKSNKVPFRLTYFQGPRTQISLVVMWRKVETSTDLSDCGSSDGYLADQDQLPTTLTSRGWKVLKPGNYLLDGYNLCQMP
ncbi:MAG: PA14 domain-containing protein [Bdellovibrionales bacterium]